ncbi:MAG TPA: hypothetical protein VKN18_17520 [Blastocatellia bacterium]|nr:hypothetical protein [Blastocatellia bacterium]
MKSLLEHLSKEQRQGIENLLNEHPFLGKLFESKIDPLISRALQILSLAPRFDFEFYKGVLLNRENGLPSFEQVLKNPDVERVPRQENQYWIRESAEWQWLAEWRERSDERASWTREMATWLRLHRREPAAVLALYLSCDLREALAFLKEEYQKADDTNDLPLCHALVEQVHSNLSQIPHADQEPFLEIIARYRARILFQQDFHRSVQYFPRDEAEQALRDIIAGKDGKWILQLHAQGGMGKTLFVQRMISHQLLKQEPYPLVARLDLDFLSVPSLSAAPWLISIEIARQLDEQLPRPLFTERQGLQADIEPFKDLLYGSRSGQRSQRSDSELLQLRQKAREHSSYWPRFRNRCADLPKNRPLLVFIDTLEEASLQAPVPLRKLLERFEELHSAVSQLRLVLSGRFELGREHLAVEYDNKLREKERVVLLSPLRGLAGENFVRDLAPGIPSKSVETIVRIGDGNPFKMSMLCELKKVDPELNIDELNKEEIDLAYLIKRIVERIPADQELGLRWLLRYGAIPRRLTFGFVRDVLQPLLIRALKGDIEAAKEDIPSEKERKVWLQDANAVLSPQTLWDQLSKYAGSHGWITLDSRDNQIAVLHADVRGPMRALLRDQPIYTHLNKAAADHFGWKSKDDPERWLEFKTIELYHRIQLGEGDLVEMTKEAFEERPETRHAGLRLEFAREVLKPEGDFSDAPDGVKAWVSFEEADALAITGGFRYMPFGERRNEILSSLKSANKLARKANFELPSFVLTWRESLESAAPRWAFAVFEFFVRPREYRARYWLLLLDMYGQSIVPRWVITVLSILSEFRSRIESSRIPQWVLRERYAASLIKRGNHRSAESLLSGILSDVVDKSELDRVRRRLIRSQLQSMELKEAEQEIPRYAEEPDQRPDRTMLMAELHFLRRDAWSALKCAEELPRDYRYHLVRGRAFGQLLRIGEAQDSFSQAKQNCDDPVLIDQILVGELQFRLFEAGMDTPPLTRTSLDPTASSLWRMELELLRAYQMKKDSHIVSGILTQLAQDRFPPTVRARALLAGIFWKVFEKTQAQNLGKILNDIEPVAAALNLLHPPVLLGEPIDLEWSARSAILNNFVVWGFFHKGFEGVHWLLYSGLLRMLKLENRKKKALARIKLNDPSSLFELAQLRQRKLLEMEAGADPVEMWSGLAAEPGLHAAALIENAERARLAGDNRDAELSLNAAHGVIEECNLDPLFGLRWRTVAERIEGYKGPLKAGPPVSEPLSCEDVVPPSPVTYDDQPALNCFSFSCVSGRLLVEESGQAEVKRVVSTTENESLNILVTSLRERSPQRLTYLMMERLKTVVEELREPFIDSPNSPLGSSAEQNVFIALKDSPLIATPWEYALPHNITLVRIRDKIGQSLNEMCNRAGPNRCVYNHSQLTKSAEAADVAMSVLVLGARGSEPNYRGYAEGYALDVGEYYEGRGAKCREGSIEATRITEFGKTSTSQVNVVHIVGYFADDVYIHEPQLSGMTAELLGRSLRAMAGRQTPLPLVILDVPMIMTDRFSVAAEQLYARNQFAQLLANTGTVSAVLGTGFCSLSSLGDAIFEAERIIDIPRIVRYSHFETLPDAEAMYSAGSLETSLGPMALALFMADEQPYYT